MDLIFEKFMMLIESQTFESITQFFYKNITVIILGFSLLMKYYIQLKPPREIPGSKVIQLKNVQEWNEKVQLTKEQDRLLVVDFYATWCPPCKTAAPIFAQWSKVFDENLVLFAKVDVDKASDISSQQGIQSMPTFLLLRGGVPVDQVIGWNEKSLQEKIEKFLPKSASS